MPTTDTKELYAEDEILSKLERAMAESSGELKSNIRAAIEDRKKKLRKDRPLSGTRPARQE